VGASAATLMPLVDAIRSHVFAAERIHADDTTVPVLAKGKTRTGRLWTYVRDDRPFAGPDPPAAVFFYSPDRGGAHPEQHLAGYVGLMQADAYAGFGRLYEANRKGGPIIEAACWAHGRRKFFDLARLSKAPIVAEAVKRIDVLFAIEREINGLTAQECLRVRQERGRPLIVELEGWSREQRAMLSRNNDTTKAINYCLSRWDAFRLSTTRSITGRVDVVSIAAAATSFQDMTVTTDEKSIVGSLDATNIRRQMRFNRFIARRSTKIDSCPRSQSRSKTNQDSMRCTARDRHWLTSILSIESTRKCSGLPPQLLTDSGGCDPCPHSDHLM